MIHIGDTYLKHTLQSLLITSVLTLPSVMGANELTAAEQTVLSSGHSNQIKFDDAIKILLDSSKSAIGDVKSRLLEFTDKQRLILETLIDPNSSAWDLYESAGSLIDDYHMEASVTASVVERAANHPEAPIAVILYAADDLGKLGKLYEINAVNLFEKAANHTEASCGDIYIASLGLLKINRSLYRGRVADLYEKAANHPEALGEFIVELADSLSSFGEAYSDRAEALRNLGQEQKKQQNP